MREGEAQLLAAFLIVGVCSALVGAAAVALVWWLS
jgi:hypothetical protein